MLCYLQVATVTLLSAWLALPAPAAAGESLAVQFNEQGLSSLQYGGAEFAEAAPPRVESVVLETVGTGPDGFRTHAFEKLAAAPTQAVFETAKKSWSATFEWGAARVRYVPGVERLGLEVTLTNATDRHLANFALELAQLRFPAKPTGLKERGNVRSALDNLVVIAAAVPQGQVVACLETVDPPVRFGFDDFRGATKCETTLVLRGGVAVEEPGARWLAPLGRPRVAPGESLTLRCSLRFAPPAADTQPLVADVYQAFAEHFAWQNDWPDRRPIGMLMRSSNYKGHKSTTNPRGWFSDPKLDITTPEGRAAFRSAALKDADRCVEVLTGLNAQGMIFWDPEGSENPHPITYIGDPRLAKTLAPEFDEVADAYFQKFLDAGLRTGVCLRPTQLYFDQKKQQWSHGTGSDGSPDRGDDYPQFRPADLPWWRYYPVVDRLCDKLTYVKKRWGCTLVYLDTNGLWQGMGEDQKFQWRLLSADMLRRVKQRHPDVLLIPELVRGDGAYHTAYWSTAAPYFELDLGGVQSPPQARRLWPRAFSILNVSDGDFAKHRDTLKAAIQAGDLLMVHGWWNPKRNAEVKALYEEAER